MLEIANIHKEFGSRVVLYDVSFTVQDGEFLSILGPSGCGKTTLIRILIGLERADRGTVIVSRPCHKKCVNGRD